MNRKITARIFIERIVFIVVDAVVISAWLTKSGEEGDVVVVDMGNKPNDAGK